MRTRSFWIRAALILTGLLAAYLEHSLPGWREQARKPSPSPTITSVQVTAVTPERQNVAEAVVREQAEEKPPPPPEEFWRFLNENPELSERIRASPVRVSLTTDQFGIRQLELERFEATLEIVAGGIKRRMEERERASAQVIYKDNQSIAVVIPAIEGNQEEEIARTEIKEVFQEEEAAHQVFVSHTWSTLDYATASFGQKNQVVFVKPAADSEGTDTGGQSKYILMRGYMDDASPENVLAAFHSVNPADSGFQLLEETTLEKLPEPGGLFWRPE